PHGGVSHAAFSPDGKRLVWRGGDRTVRVGEPGAWKEIGRLDEVGRVTVAALSPDGTLLASAEADGSVCLWEVPAGKLRRRWQGHAGTVASVAFSPDGTAL